MRRAGGAWPPAEEESLNSPGPKPPPAVPSLHREFYEEIAERRLHPHTARGIEYRNQTVAGRLAGGPHLILEIGPGEGWLARRLLGLGHRVVTIDLSRKWLARLPSAGHPALLRSQGNALELPFADATFDRVVAAEVLEHLPGPLVAAREARRVLKPGGRFVATVPWREVLHPVHCPHCGGTFEPNGHLNSFDEESFRALFRQAGLDPGFLFRGPTRFSREIWRRWPAPFLLGAMHAIDRATLPGQRVSDTWMLLEGSPLDG